MVLKLSSDHGEILFDSILADNKIQSDIIDAYRTILDSEVKRVKDRDSLIDIFSREIERRSKDTDEHERLNLLKTQLEGQLYKLRTEHEELVTSLNKSIETKNELILNLQNQISTIVNDDVRRNRINSEASLRIAEKVLESYRTNPTRYS